MLSHYRWELSDIKKLLMNPETTPETVQKIFTQYWEKRDGRPGRNGDVYVVPIKVVDREGVVGSRVVFREDLFFPKAKLTSAQIELLEDKINSLFGWW